MEDNNKYRFDAFISYYQNPDKELAKAIVLALQQLGREWYLLKFRALNIFRDETGTSGNAALKQKILSGIENSNFLVILASKKGKPIESNRKDWVNEEAIAWLELKDSSNNPKIIICITDGNIEWDYNRNDFNWDITDCLPSILREKKIFKDAPKWIDLRDFYDETESLRINILKLDYPEFKQKIAEISSQIQGITVDELIAKDRNYKRIGWVLIVALFCILCYLGVSFRLSQKDAEEQRDLAKIETKKANERLRQVELLRVKEFVRNAQIFNESESDIGKLKAKEMKTEADFIFKKYTNDSLFIRESKILKEVLKKNLGL
jgi:TIR domain